MSQRARKAAGAAGTAEVDEIARLRTELAARVAECEWLKSHYEQHLRDALARIEVLRSAPPPPSAAAMEEAAARDAEIRQLRQERERLLAAEQRYLDRIAELKDELAEQPSQETVR